MATSDSDRVVVACTCGAKLRAPTTLAGKRVKCPKCASPILVPGQKSGVSSSSGAPAKQKPSEVHKPAEALAPLGSLRQKSTGKAPKASAAVVPAPVALDEGDDFLTGLAGHETASVAEPMEALPTVGAPCPGCGGVMATGSVVCTQCGFDTRKGKASKTQIGPGKAEMATKAAGRFMLGVTFCSVGGLIGGVIWFVVGWYMSLEIGYVAWGIGALCGFGMLLGNGQPNRFGGLIAAAIAALAITAAKAAIFVALIGAHIERTIPDAPSRTELVKSYLTNEMLDKKGLKPGDERDAAWDRAYEEAEAKVSGMSQDQIDELWERYSQEAEDDEAERVEREAQAAADSTGGEPPSAEEPPSIFSIFFKAMFGLHDLLWFGLGLVTAFQVAARGSGSDD